MSFKISKSDLQLKLNKKDSNVTFGESYRFAEIQKILIRNEEDDEFIESGFVICTQCNLMVLQSDGSHLKRHVITTCKKRKISIGRSELEPIEQVRKIKDYSTKKLKDSEVQKITSALGRYCLKTGKSFHHLGSENMKKLLIEICNSISTGYGEVALKQLPCRLTIQKVTEKLAESLIKKAVEYLEPYKSRIHLAIDHGKLVTNYLSVFATFLDDDCHLQVVPLAFTPQLDGKTGKQTADLIVEKLESFGWEEDEILKFSVTADGALSTIGNYFDCYVCCVSHSLNLVAQRVLNPKKIHKPSLTDVLPKIEEYCAVMEASALLASVVRQTPSICETLTKLPTLSCETRWMTNIKCLWDIDSCLQVV
ncbi:hypothetical protein L3Y34_002192 [Caenorhabditis briggsae]|uniref:Uncharacterized protein n=1 Tax=Caenorhabditis briggsae TaxID=6238 RepID=A0AAE9DFI4_CAEBR|nr:hypothetical protein L3Y34_002192 [Caenorhabditis briggsae]